MDRRRSLPSALLLLCLIFAGRLARADEDLLSDLRAEVAAMIATAKLTSATQVKGDGGPQYVTHALTLTGTEVTDRKSVV